LKYKDSSEKKRNGRVDSAKNARLPGEILLHRLIDGKVFNVNRVARAGRATFLACYSLEMKRVDGMNIRLAKASFKKGKNSISAYRSHRHI
jgi:hypothetical protein